MKVSLYLSPALSAYGDAVRESADVEAWRAPGLSRSLSRIVRRLGPVMLDARPDLSEADLRTVCDVICDLLALRDVEDDTLPPAARIAAELEDALSDVPTPAELALVAAARRWTPLEVWSLVEATAGDPIAVAATEPARRPRVAGPGRPPKIQCG